MHSENEDPAEPAKNPTTVQRKSDRELVVTRSFDAPARIVFEAWTKQELFSLWWVPKSFGLTLLSCEIDARTGGTYRLVFRHPAAAEPMAFYGRYIEIVPDQKMVWTNEEGGEGGTVTTVTFTEDGGKTVVAMHDLYASKESLDEAIASGSTSGASESFGQLEEFLHTQRHGDRL